MQRRGDRPDRGGRPRRRRARDDAGRRAGDPRRPRRRRRRPPFDGARAAPASRSTISARRWTCCGSACRDKPSDPAETHGPHRRRQHPGHARPRRLLAVRLRHSQGRPRRCKRPASRRSARRSPGSCRSLADRVDELADLGRREAADRRASTGCEHWWQPGLLCIGDAAHAMSPIGGVGINLAVQDAVAAANILAAPLKEGRLKDSDLAAVQAHRLWPVRATQAIQVFLQNRMIAPTLAGTRPLRPPWPARLLNAVPYPAPHSRPRARAGRAARAREDEAGVGFRYFTCSLIARAWRTARTSEAPRSASSLPVASSVNLPSANWSAPRRS